MSASITACFLSHDQLSGSSGLVDGRGISLSSGPSEPSSPGGVEEGELKLLRERFCPFTVPASSWPGFGAGCALPKPLRPCVVVLMFADSELAILLSLAYVLDFYVGK